MTRRRGPRPAGVIAGRALADLPEPAAWRAAWVAAARRWSTEAQTIAARAPLELIGPRMLELALAGQLHPPDDENILDQLFKRAHEIDSEACEAYDRQGVATPKPLADRRCYALVLAADEYMCGSDPRLAEALHSRDGRTRH